MQIKFVGESSGRVCAGHYFPHGEPVDVPADLARSLLEQPTFEAVKTAKTQKQEND